MGIHETEVALSRLFLYFMKLRPHARNESACEKKLNLIQIKTLTRTRSMTNRQNMMNRDRLIETDTEKQTQKQI